MLKGYVARESLGTPGLDSGMFCFQIQKQSVSFDLE